ncbi:MAG: TetR/AcrR family transcriptional regulator [Gammaproteobacteria bacterium]
MPRKTDKRHRLIDAAKVLIHKQGFNLTTLADIAQEADVPLGNVYYYFKTKDAIGVAVIDKWSSDFASLFLYLKENSDPLVRLNAILQVPDDELEAIARFGCPIGGLCLELGKQGGPLADQTARILHDLLGWAELQFNELGLVEKAVDHALHFVSAIQGAYLLAHTFKDPKIALRQFENLRIWLSSITGRVVQNNTMTAYPPVYNFLSALCVSNAKLSKAMLLQESVEEFV